MTYCGSDIGSKSQAGGCRIMQQVTPVPDNLVLQEGCCYVQCVRSADLTACSIPSTALLLLLGTLGAEMTGRNSCPAVAAWHCEVNVAPSPVSTLCMYVHCCRRNVHPPGVDSQGRPSSTAAGAAAAGCGTAAGPCTHTLRRSRQHRLCRAYNNSKG